MPRRTRESDEEPEEMDADVMVTEDAEPSIPKAEPVATPVSIIERVGKAAVVQWMEGDDYHKSTIPAEEIVEGQVRESVLQAGEGSFTWEAAGLDPIWAKALRKARVFDPEDFGDDPNRAIKAIQKLIHSTLTRAVKEYRHG